MVSMNPNRGENLNHEATPAPISGGEASDGLMNEAQPSHQESSPSKQPSAPTLPVTPVNMPTAQPVVIPNDTDDDAKSLADSNSQVDAHPDRIEKQWVDKAKAIVMQTKDDPFTQKDEMSKIKSEYIKSRFNKSLKSG